MPGAKALEPWRRAWPSPFDSLRSLRAPGMAPSMPSKVSCTLRLACLWVAFLALLPGIFGCPVIRSMPNRGQILHREEAVSGQPYELYVPGTYHTGRLWPLVVTCHGTPPFDSASLQVREWADVAEKKGLLVAAPVLKGTHARNDAKRKTVQQQIELQRFDEETILATVNHVRAGYRVDDGKIFLTGWSAGNYAVLWTGLGHPEIFRALAVRQGNFNAAFLAPIEQRIDTQQQIMVFYGQMDLLRSQAEACIRWLKEHGLPVVADGAPGAHQRDAALAERYFEGVVQGSPWLVVRWEPSWAGNPLAVHFRVKTDPPSEKVEWTLGDGQTSQGHALTHTYAAGGSYDVTVRAIFARRQQIERRLRITVAPAAAFQAPASQPAGPAATR
jgi:poly(3-hydroxybutyrate) depolymerase